MVDTIVRPTWLADNAHWEFPEEALRDWMHGKRIQVVTTEDIGVCVVSRYLSDLRGPASPKKYPLLQVKSELPRHLLDFKSKTENVVPATYK